MFLAFVIIVYYNALIAWVCRMFVYSIQGSAGRWASGTGSSGYDWFVATGTGLEPSNSAYAVQGLIGANVGALAFVWATVFLCLAFGVRWTGRIAFITASSGFSRRCGPRSRSAR